MEIEEEGYAKLTRFCLYRERCTSEVLERLRETALPEDKFPAIIQRLKDDGYLNEERFVRAFTNDKFHLKKWGRNKIRYELRIKKADEKLVERTLQEMDDAAYIETLTLLAEKKWQELKKEKDPWTRQSKLIRFLLGKGYEYDLAKEVSKTLK